MSWKIYDCPNIIYADVDISYDNRLDRYRLSFDGKHYLNTRYKNKKKYLVFGPNNNQDIRSFLNYNSKQVQNNSKLFISPSCKTPRDMFRNSGYKIVRDKNNADIIVVPNIEHSEIVFNANIVSYISYNNTLVLFNARNLDDVDKYVVAKIKTDKYFIDDINNIIKYYLFSRDERDKIAQSCINEYLNLIDSRCVFSIPYIEEYKEIFLNKYTNYATVSNVPFTPSRDIDLDTLIIWYNQLKAQKRDLAFASMACSNFKEYWFTIIMLLKLTDNSYNIPDKYDMFVKNRTLSDDFVVLAKDWNLYQDFIMYMIKWHTKDNVTSLSIASQFLGCDYEFRLVSHLFLKAGLVVKPMYIKEDTQLSVLKSLLRQN